MASTKRGDGEAISGFGGVTAGRVKMLNSRGDTIDFVDNASLPALNLVAATEVSWQSEQ